MKSSSHYVLKETEATTTCSLKQDPKEPQMQHRTLRRHLQSDLLQKPEDEGNRKQHTLSSIFANVLKRLALLDDTTSHVTTAEDEKKVQSQSISVAKRERINLTIEILLCNISAILPGVHK